MGATSEVKLRLRADKVKSELFDLHSDLRAVERRIRVLGCSNVGGKSRTIQRDLSDAREQKGRIQGQIRAAESLLDSVLQQMKRQQQVQRSPCSRASSSAASASHPQQGAYHSEQLPWRPHTTPAKDQSLTHNASATHPHYTDPNSDSDQGSLAVDSASTQSQRCHTAYRDMTFSGHVAHTASPSYSGTETVDVHRRATCTVATSMGDLSGTCMGQDLTAQELPMRYQEPVAPCLESPASTRLQRTRSLQTYRSHSGRQLGTDPKETEAHLSDMNSLSPYTDTSIMNDSNEESRAAAVQSWIVHHSGLAQMQGLEPVQSQGDTDNGHCASLDAFLHQDAPANTQIGPDRRHGEYLGSCPPYQRCSLSIFDSPQELPSHAGAAVTSHSPATTHQKYDRYQADACRVGSTAPPPDTDSDIPKIEKWLRAIGKARGWDLGLLDDLLKQNLAGVLATDSAAEAQDDKDPSLRISQMNPRSNPLALQAFVSQCGVQATDQHREEHYGRSMLEQTPGTDAGAMDTQRRHGTADTLVHAAWAHLLHRPLPSAAHPHANLLQESFELLERHAADTQASSTKNVERRMDGQIHAQGVEEDITSQNRVGLGPGQASADPVRSAASRRKVQPRATTNSKSPTSRAVPIEEEHMKHGMPESSRKAAHINPKGERIHVSTPSTAMHRNQAVRTRDTRAMEQRSGDNNTVPRHSSTCKKGLRIAGPGHVLHGRKAKPMPQFVEDDRSMSPEAKVHLSDHVDTSIRQAGPLFSLQRTLPIVQEQHVRALDLPLSTHAKRSCIKSHRLVFEYGELEAIAAGVDLLEWKNLMKNRGESSKQDARVQFQNTEWHHPSESPVHSVSEDGPTLLQSPDPNTVCGNISSPLSTKTAQHVVDPIVRKSHTRVTRSALFRAAVNPSNLESIAEDLN